MKTNFSIALLVGLAAMVTHSASAQIIFSGVQNITLSRTSFRSVNPTVFPDSTALNLDLNGDGTKDFSFFSYQPTPSPTFILFGARGLNGTQYEALSSSVLQAFSVGASIGSGPQWTQGDPGFPLAAGQNWWKENFFGAVGASSAADVYIGIKLNISNQLHFGWINYELPVGTGSDLVIKGWAYQNSVGAAIVAGDRGAPLAAVPEPATYGMGSALLLCSLILLRKGVQKVANPNAKKGDT